jgi:hypothetical protein
MIFDCFELNIIRRFASHFHDDYEFTGETFIDTYDSFNVLTDDKQQCALHEALRKLVLSCHDNEEFVSRIAELGGPGLGSSKNSFELAKQAIASGVPGTSRN